jgi:ribose transport system substrate-binding protein
MALTSTSGTERSNPLLNGGWSTMFLVALVGLAGCSPTRRPMIAFIPRTSATMLWEPAHVGAQDAANNLGLNIYWNAPTREDDVAGQISLIERILRDGDQGLILAPDQALALITPVRRAMAKGIATVVIGSSLPIPPGDNLSYIVNDEVEGGRIAARRVAFLLHGKGSVALLGINPAITGIMIRARSCEQFLNINYPNIHIVETRSGSFSLPHEQQMAEETLKENPDLDAIIALTWSSARGSVSTIESSVPVPKVKVIGFDPTGLLFEAKTLDSVILQNTREMGDRAIRMIDARLHGQPMQGVVTLQPMLVTRENVGSEKVRIMTTMHSARNSDDKRREYGSSP